MRSGEIAYCHSWNYRRRRIGIALTEADARTRDTAGEAFMAVVPVSGPHPALVDVAWENQCIAVTFLDPHGRKSLKYFFYKVNRSGGSAMFLRTAYLWEYPSDDPRLRESESTKRETYSYREDGHARRVVVDEIEQYKDTAEWSEVPIDKNWEPVPSFGDYWSIARRER
jgi:hypothetical protein